MIEKLKESIQKRLKEINDALEFNRKAEMVLMKEKQYLETLNI